MGIRSINLDIGSNEVISMVGPSGCGKSTLLRCLNRMNDLIEGVTISGKLDMDGENIYGNIDVSDLRIKVGMVFQKPNPFPMSIYDNVAFGLKLHNKITKSKTIVIHDKTNTHTHTHYAHKPLKKTSLTNP